MPRVSRRSVLEALSVAGAVAIAGCAGEASRTSATPTRTATPTPTTTATPRADLGETLGFTRMLDVTPAHPGMTAETFVWARYVDAEGVLTAVEDETLRGRLRDGWLGSGPPQYTDSDAFELVHVQPGGLSNLTVGRGDFDTSTAVEGLRDDGWTHVGTADGYARLERGNYTMAVGDRYWVVVQETGTDRVQALLEAVDTDPLSDYLGDIDAEAIARAGDERGNYRVLERAVGEEGYAAGITVDHAAYRVPVGVMQYGKGRESPSWERIEHQFEHRIVGEVRSSDFGDDFR